MMNALRNIVRDRRGAVAASFVLMLPVMLAGMAMAIDYSTFRITYTRMQTAADAAALAAIDDLSLSDAEKVQKALDIIGQNIPDDYGDVTKASDVILGTYTKDGVFTPAAGAAVNAARVASVRSAARGNEVNRIFSMFISKEALTISTVAIAARPVNVAYEPPEISVLDSTAHDFNELYAYCYDPATSTRGEMKLIANNMRANVTLSMFPQHPTDSSQNLKQPDTANWPKCEGEGESVSFYLRNYRGANQTRTQLWAAAPKHEYTDTKLVDGQEISNKFKRDDPLTPSVDERRNNLVETIMCDTKDLCDPSKANNMVGGGEGKKKDPANVETRACSPGKYMYYGWEDRPPSGSSDRDYNDITIVLRCPSAGQLGGGKPRLVG